MAVTIGLSVVPHRTDMKSMRNAWVKAEELGVDVLYSADHFHDQINDAEQAMRVSSGDSYGKVLHEGSSFEGTTIQAAMAMTTSRARIGAICHAIGYRNPNLMADIARTIDHLSGGRFILGMGTGYLKADYEDYGYEFGTQTSRAEDLARGIPIIKERFKKLNPGPMGPLPILIASMGEKIGMRVVAEHADMWHVYGPMDKIQQKIEVLRQLCHEVGRDFSDIELITYYWPQISGLDENPVDYLAEGFKHIVCVAQGPKWDFGQLREVLQWRDSLPPDA